MDRFITSTSNKKIRLAVEAQNVDDPTTNFSTQVSLTNAPTPYYKYLFDEFYKLQNVENLKVTAVCQNCPKVVSGSTKSSGNFLSHIKRKHNSLMPKVENARKKKDQETSTMIQTKIYDTPKVSKELVKDLVFNYIVEEMKPLATCEKPSFKRLIRGLTSDSIVLPYIVTDDTHISDSNYLGLISSDDSDSDDNITISSGDDVNSSNLEFDVVDLSSLILNYKETITNTISLPSHITCSAHTLNLIASVDTAKIVDQAYNSISKSTFKKLSSFWNLLSRSTVVSDKVFDLCSCKFPVPNLTRWNSIYDAVHKVIKNKQNLVLVFNELKIKKMKKNEWSFLEEYCKVMGPLAISLDKLQGEKSSYLGFVAPTILALRLLLIQMNDLVHCRPLCFNIISNLEKRFDYILDLKKVKSKSFILSAISHPKFKLSWVPDRYKSYCKQIFIDECNSIKTDNDVVLNTNENIDSDSSDQEFFQILSENCLDVEIDIHSNRNNINVQALEYLHSNNKDFTVLNSFSIIKKIFFKYNTTLPSSAPVERLFSSGSQIMTPRRNRLNDKTFEMLLCCRCQNLNSNKL